MAKPTSSIRVNSRIEWKIENIYSACNQETEEFEFQKSYWKLALEKVTVAGSERIRIHLEQTSREGPFAFMSRAFLVHRSDMPDFLIGHAGRSAEDFYKYCVWWMDIEDFRRSEAILPTNGVVSLACILMPKPTSGDVVREIKPVQVSTKAKAEGSVETLLLDFHRLLDDTSLSDVTLKCGDRTIPAHRIILSSRSNVFAAMLRSDMTESQNGVIKISDMDPPVLDQFLQFIYSCKLPDMSMDTAPQLYEAADKYGVASLMKDCSAFMTENLTDENACCILLLADTHSDKDLKECVVSFIMKTKLFLKDDIWLKFCENQPKLAVDILNRVCRTCRV